MWGIFRLFFYMKKVFSIIVLLKLMMVYWFGILMEKCCFGGLLVLICNECYDSVLVVGLVFVRKLIMMVSLGFSMLFGLISVI